MIEGENAAAKSEAVREFLQEAEKASGERRRWRIVSVEPAAASAAAASSSSAASSPGPRVVSCISSDSSPVVATLDASAASEDSLSYLPVFHASFLASWHGSNVADFKARCSELLASLDAEDAAADRFGWIVEGGPNVAPAFAGRMIADSESQQDQSSSAWSMLGEDSPLLARKKMQNKAAAAAAASSSSHSASASSSASASFLPSMSLPEYAIELSLLQRSVRPVAEGALAAAPSLVYTQCASGGLLRTLTVSLSVLHYAAPTAELSSVLSALRAALVAQLRQLRTKLESELPALLLAAPTARALTAQALHFLPLSLPHALTALYLHEALPAVTGFGSAAAAAASASASSSSSSSSASSGDVMSTTVLFPPPPPEDDLDAIHPALLLHPAEARLTPQRARLHTVWNLRRDGPAFRFANALHFPSQSATIAALGLESPSARYIVQPRLFNVHASILRSSGVSAPSSLAAVRGTYAYYHYLQDRESDSGWGCAYRTLQSICSYFILGGWTRGRGVPSLRDIQGILVRSGDKSPSFLGSREWIGSTEVGLVLRWAYGLECKTLFVSSGAEVASHARVFLDHFRTQGTPIMIGGGVLAYGLLGVDFNAGTGECRFLILDPHYTGADNLANILKGGWVGWKKEDLFLRDHFYNFAMPQRPKEAI